MVAPVLYGIGSLAARFGMPIAKELVKKYGPGIVDAIAGTSAGAYIGDKLFNPFIDIDPNINKPQIEIFPELTEEEKLPQTTGGVTDIDDLINEPLIMAQDPDAGKSITLSTPPLSPEEQSPTIYTMANPKFDEEGNRIYRINNKTYTEDELNFKGDGRTYRDIESVKTEAKTYLSKEQFKTGFEEFLNNNPDFMKNIMLKEMRKVSCKIKLKK